MEHMVVWKAVIRHMVDLEAGAVVGAWVEAGVGAGVWVAMEHMVIQVFVI